MKLILDDLTQPHQQTIAVLTEGAEDWGIRRNPASHGWENTLWVVKDGRLLAYFVGISWHPFNPGDPAAWKEIDVRDGHYCPRQFADLFKKQVNAANSPAPQTKRAAAQGPDDWDDPCELKPESVRVRFRREEPGECRVEIHPEDEPYTIPDTVARQLESLPFCRAMLCTAWMSRLYMQHTRGWRAPRGYIKIKDLKDLA